MKFFILILISNYQSVYSVYLDDAPGIPEPFHPLYFQYSRHHSQLPISADPSISCPTSETLAEEDEMCVLSSFLSFHLHSPTEGTQYECVHDLYLPLPLIYEHSQHCISEQASHDSGTEYLLSKHGNDTWSPIQHVPLIDLLNDSLFCILPFSKSKKFIETKVAEIKLQGFNQCLRY